MVASTVVQRDDLMAGMTAVWLVAHWGWKDLKSVVLWARQKAVALVGMKVGNSDVPSVVTLVKTMVAK